MEKIYHQLSQYGVPYNTLSHVAQSQVSPAKIKRVKALKKKKNNISLRKASRTTNISRHYINRILKKVLGRNAYKATKTQYLEESQKLSHSD